MLFLLRYHPHCFLRQGCGSPIRRLAGKEKPLLSLLPWLWDYKCTLSYRVFVWMVENKLRFSGLRGKSFTNGAIFPDRSICVCSLSSWYLCSSSHWHRMTLNLLCNPGCLECMTHLPQSLESLRLQVSALSPSNNRIFEHFHHNKMVNMWPNEMLSVLNFYTLCTSIKASQNVICNVYDTYYIHEKYALFFSSLQC